MNHNLIKQTYAKKNLKMLKAKTAIKLDITAVVQENTEVLQI